MDSAEETGLLQKLRQLRSDIASGIRSPGDANTRAGVLPGKGVARDELAHTIEPFDGIAFAIEHLAGLIDLNARDRAEGTQGNLLGIERGSFQLRRQAAGQREFFSRDLLAGIVGSYSK